MKKFLAFFVSFVFVFALFGEFDIVEAYYDGISKYYISPINHKIGDEIGDEDFVLYDGGVKQPLYLVSLEKCHVTEKVDTTLIQVKSTDESVLTCFCEEDNKIMVKGESAGTVDIVATITDDSACPHEVRRTITVWPKPKSRLLLYESTWMGLPVQHYLGDNISLHIGFDFLKPTVAENQLKITSNDFEVKKKYITNDGIGILEVIPLHLGECVITVEYEGEGLADTYSTYVSEPAPEQVSEEPAPEQVSEEPAPEQVSEEPAPEQVSEEPAPEQVSEEPTQVFPDIWIIFIYIIGIVIVVVIVVIIRKR